MATADEIKLGFKSIQQYDTEFKRLFASFTSARKYTYSHLKTDGASFTDKASVFFKTRNKELTVRNWSDDFNMFVSSQKMAID